MRTIGNFTETNKKVTITFNGWDGKSYDGEGQNMNIWVNPRIPEKQFVCKRQRGEHIFFVITNRIHPVSGKRIVEFYS